MIDYQIEITEPINTAENKKALKPYLKPCLEDLGDLRSVTLGPTIGLGESGDPGNLWNGI